MPRKYVPLTNKEKAWRKFVRQNWKHPIMQLVVGHISLDTAFQELLKIERRAEKKRIKQQKEQQKKEGEA